MGRESRRCFVMTDSWFDLVFLQPILFGPSLDLDQISPILFYVCQLWIIWTSPDWQHLLTLDIPRLTTSTQSGYQFRGMGASKESLFLRNDFSQSLPPFSFSLPLSIPLPLPLSLISTLIRLSLDDVTPTTNDATNSRMKEYNNPSYILLGHTSSSFSSSSPCC